MLHQLGLLGSLTSWACAMTECSEHSAAWLAGCLSGCLSVHRQRPSIVTYPMQVGGALLGFAVERISVGMQHVAAQASPLDKKTGLPQVSLYRPLKQERNGKIWRYCQANSRPRGWPGNILRCL